MNKYSISKVLGIFALSSVVALGLAGKALAFTPTLQVVNLTDVTGGGSIQLIVNADPSSNVYLYSSSPVSGYIDVIGHTNGSGYLSATVAPTGYHLTTGQTIYVAVNGQASNSVTWPALNQVAPAGYGYNSYNYNYQYPTQTQYYTPAPQPVTYPTYPQSYPQNNYYYQRNPAPTLSLSNANMNAGSSQTITIYGIGGFYINTNTNSYAASASLSGNVLTINANAVGTAVITICQADSQCATLTVTVTQPMVYYPQNYANYNYGTYSNYNQYSYPSYAPQYQVATPVRWYTPVTNYFSSWGTWFNR